MEFHANFFDLFDFTSFLPGLFSGPLLWAVAESELKQTIIFFCIFSAIYMRSISEKKRSAAAIKSLLDLMAENRSLQSVYTMDGLYATSNQYESPPERLEKVVQNDQGKVYT